MVKSLIFSNFANHDKRGNYMNTGLDQYMDILKSAIYRV